MSCPCPGCEAESILDQTTPNPNPYHLAEIENFTMTSKQMIYGMYLFITNEIFTMLIIKTNTQIIIEYVLFIPIYSRTFFVLMIY